MNRTTNTTYSPSRGLQPCGTGFQPVSDPSRGLQPARCPDRQPGLRRKCAAPLCLAALLCCAATTAIAQTIDYTNPPQGLFSEDWLEVYLGGGKIGYGHSTMRREGDLIHTEMEMKLRIGRANQFVEMAVTSGTVETLDGRPKSFISNQDMSIYQTVMRGEIIDGTVHITQSQPKIQLEKKLTFPYPEGALMVWGAFREGVVRGYKPGVSYTARVYSPDLRLDDAIETTMQVGEWETKQVFGRNIRGMKVTAEMNTPLGDIEMHSWVNERGDVLLAEMPVQGLGNMQLLTVDQQAALADFVPAEIFMKTTIKVPPIDTDKVRAIRFKVSLTGEGDDPLDLPTTGMQTPRPIDERSAEVIVHRQVHQRTGSGGDVDPSALEPYLQSNLMINLEDEALRKLAEKAAGETDDPFVLADNLRRFVRDHIEDKNLDVGFATASEVCRSREGDCSEHGVLLAALGRIKGLPSRVVVGIAYAPIFGGRSDILGYHMWTQFFIDGQWYDFDAALGDEVAPNPGRIALAVTSLKDASLADISIPLLSKIGSLQIEILDMK